MFKVTIIGNLGADAERKDDGGRVFYTFRVAHTRQVTNLQTNENREETTWFSCIMDGNRDGLLPYLKKGQKVYVEGYGSLRCFSSEKYRTWIASCDVRVTQVELVGASVREREWMQQANEQLLALEALGYHDISEIPPKKTSPGRKTS